MKKYRAYVTIVGEREDTSIEFLDLFLEIETGDFEEARSFYESVNVKPFGVLAHTLHVNHPEYVRLEADYDIEQLVGPDYEYSECDWYYIESIWYED